MGNLFGGSTGSESAPGFPDQLSELGYLLGGHTPYSGGIYDDTFWAGAALPGRQVYGHDSPLTAQWNRIPSLFAAGAMGQGLTADALNQGYGNAMWGAQAGFNQGLNQANLYNTLVPNVLQASNYYLNQGVTPAIQGKFSSGPSGAGNRVVDAGLGFGADVSAIQRRAIAEGLPQVRASYSARGLGLGGEAARGEQDYVQRISDAMAQQAIDARLGGLQAAAAAAGPAASEAVGFGNIGLGRGQLGLQAAQAPFDIMGSMINGNNAALQGLNLGQQMQGYPQQLMAAGMNNYFNGFNLPLQAFQNFIQTQRYPQNQAMTFLGGTAGTASSPVFTGIFGIPYGSSGNVAPG